MHGARRRWLVCCSTGERTGPRVAKADASPPVVFSWTVSRARRWSVALAIVASCAGAQSAVASKPYDFDRDGRQELVAGLPHFANGGVVLVVPGAKMGLDVDSRDVISPASVGLPSGGEFGAAVASADFDGDHFADLAIGSRSARFRDDAWPAVGAVTVMYGGAAGLTGVRPALFQGPTTGGFWDDWTLFGATLAAGDLNRDGYGDLAIAAIGESPMRDGGLGSGAIHVLFGGPNGLTRDGERLLADHGVLTMPSAIRLPSVTSTATGIWIWSRSPGDGDATDFEDVAGHLSYCAGGPAGPLSCRSAGRKERHGTASEVGLREAPA